MATVLMLLTNAQPVSALPWDFDGGNWWETGKSYVRIQESYDVGQPSRVKFWSTKEGSNSNHSYICIEFPSEACSKSLLGKTFGDPPAGTKFPYQTLSFELVMPACQDAIDKNWCIEDVRIYGDGSESESASFIESVGPETTPALPEWGIPAGGHISLWQGGTQYPTLKLAAVVQVNFVYYPFSGTKYVAQDFNVQLIPYEIDTATPYPYINTVQSTDVPTGAGYAGTLALGCIWQRSGSCGKRIDSPSDVRYGLTIRSNVGIAEFFNGRLQDPTIDVQKANGVTTLSLDAMPVTVAEFGLVYDNTPALVAEMPFLTGSHSTKPYMPDARKMIEGFRELAGDKASGENTSWRISSLGISGLNSCYKNYGVAGIVTTNATTYGGEPPALKGGFLNYEVAGMHYLSNGADLFTGTYDLIINSEVARCLYGFTKAPVSATITVVGANGAENIATTNVFEKNGWLKLAAYGFTFSEKEIKVKLQQPKIQTLTNYVGRATALSSKQKAEISAIVKNYPTNSKFICTGIRYFDQPVTENVVVRKRAKLACEYAKSLNPKLSTFYQTKTTQAKSYNGKVLVVSK